MNEQNALALFLFGVAFGWVAAAWYRRSGGK